MGADLRSIWFLSDLDEGQIRSLALLCVTRRFPRGKRLCSAGDPSPGLFLLLSGSVKLSTITAEGVERILSVRSSGESIGEEGLVDDRPLEATAEALTETVALLIPREQFQARLATTPALGLAVARALAERLRQTADLSRDVLTLDARRRIVKQVIMLSERSPDSLLPPLRQQDLASLAGASRETVSRLLSDLVSQGYLGAEGRRLRVADRAGLQHLVAVSPPESGRGLHKENPVWTGSLPVSDHAPEVRLVTVLFAELELGPSSSSEESFQLAERFRASVAAALDRYGGHIQGLYGGTAVALFGVPQPREQAAGSACHAALEISAQLAELPGGAGVRLALWSGEAVVALRDGACAVSADLIGLAAQLVRLVPRGQVWAGASTQLLARRSFAFSPTEGGQALEAVRLERPLAAEEMQSEGPFVARRGELDLLLAELVRVSSSESRRAVVVGEAGVGKSRLVLELMRQSPAGKLRWAVGRSAVYGQESPYFLLTDLLNELQRFPDLAEGSRRLLEGLQTGNRPAVERQEHQKELARGLSLMLRQASPPVALVLEDLHWADPPSLAVLGILRLPFQIATARPGYQNPWSDAVILRLEPLAGEAAAELAQLLLPDAELPHDLALMLVGLTGGNPFFLEETVATLERAGALTPSAGFWCLAPAPSGTVLMPVTVQEGLIARFGQLALQERQEVLAEQLAAYGRASRGGPPRSLHLFALLNRGDLEGAAALLPHLPSPEREMPPFRTLAVRAEVARLQGERQAARALLAEEAALADVRRVSFALLDVRVRQAELEAEAGDLDAAQRFALAATAVQTDSPYLTGRALRIRGQVALERGEGALALSLLEQACALLETTGAAPERAVAHRLRHLAAAQDANSTA